jgi:hypothetical protein
MHLPRIYRAVGQPRLHLRMPYGDGANRAWLRDTLGARIRPDWNRTDKRWEVSRTHLMVLAHALADRFGAVDVFLEFSTTQKCDRRCREAVGDDCECSCLGAYHAGGLWGAGWVEVGETTLIRAGWQVRHLRLTA